MSWTDNPLADFDRHEREQQKLIDKLPVCYECGKPIQAEECYEINDEIICPECLKDNHRKKVEDYIE